MKYFKIEEFGRSETAKRLGIDNSMPGYVRENIEALVEMVLDPLREAWGRPIAINSGYRSVELNRAVGGVWNSNHLSGEAADLKVGSMAELESMADMVVSLGLPFDELLLERNSAGAIWLHVAYHRDGNNRYKKRYIQGR